MDENKFELNTEGTETGDIFSVNIFESNEPKLQENLPGSNAPSTPERKNGDESSIAVPSATEIPLGAYNDAISNLQKVIKESADALDMLKNVRPVVETVEDAQEAFTESVIENALFESYCEGPYFESVKNPDKGDIKAAIKAIRKAAPKTNDDNYSLRVFPSMAKDVAKAAAAGAVGATIGGIISTAVLAPIVGAKSAAVVAGTATAVGVPVMGAVGAGAGAGTHVGNKMYVRALRENKEFTTKLWQMVGVFNTKDDDLAAALKHYTELFKEQLGEFVFNSIKLKAGKTKQLGSCYILTVDGSKTKTGVIELDIKDDKEEKKEDKKEEK